MIRCALAASLFVAIALVSSPASSQPVAAPSEKGAAPAIGFSNLLVRIEGQDEIAFAGNDFRVLILEALRKAGFRAVGAENLVFGQDRSNQADYVLGGTVKELEPAAS